MTRERFDGRLVKEFKRPASDRELILKAFQEQSWARRKGAWYNVWEAPRRLDGLDNGARKDG